MRKYTRKRARSRVCYFFDFRPSWGQRTQITYDGGTTYRCDLMGRVTNVIDSAGVSLTNCYNNQGLLCVVSNVFGLVSKAMFDAEDNPIQVTDANSVTHH